MFRSNSLRVGASALSAAFLYACFPLLAWHHLVWVALAPLLVALLVELNAKRGFWLGYLCGVIFFASSCQWFVDVMEMHGGLAPVLAWGVLGLFALLFAVFFGAFGWAVSRTAVRVRTRALILAPFFWVVGELGRTYLFTGVPWNLLGYAMQAGGLRRIATVTAVYGLSFLALATSSLIAWVILEPRRNAARLAVLIWPVVLIVANWLLAPPPVAPGSRVVHLVQPNIGMNVQEVVKWAPWSNPEPLQRLVDKSIASVRADATTGPKPFIIWPENPAPFYFERDPIFRSAAERMARESGAYVVVGSVNFADAAETQPKNSAMVLNPQGQVLLAYDKIHLVPFGEYVPDWAFPNLVGKITHEAGNFVPGSSYRAAETPEGALSLFICYESIFPQLVRRLVPEGPAVLVNLSNDAWFGDTAAAAQHLEKARLRAIENRRYLLRATNDGITCIIDPYGRIVARLPRHESAILTGRFDFVAGDTFYTRYGDVFAWMCVAIVVMAMTHQYWREEQIKRQEAKGKSQK
ncbi:MAG: apolipoprotein N-acyltransferase [Acidobacteria bacterium]|nr:apolipoprotein N-acyltransferase [Acidobacteriota bacterium]